MFGLLQIYFLFNLHFILLKCDPREDLSVRITDQKLVERKRQDTRDMCRIFNSELKASLPTAVLPVNKYDKRKKEFKLKEKKENIQNKKTHRIKRAVNSINPALNVEDEQRVETIVDKIYDDLLEKGQMIAYRRKQFPKSEPVSPRQKIKGYTSAAHKPGRRFPFAPHMLDDKATTIRSDHIEELASSKPVRFPNAIVPYFIDATTYDTHLAELITKAFDYFEKATCIRLQRLRERPRDQQSLQNVTWLYITNPSGIRQCVHSNERAKIQGVQMITFGYDCMSVGDISHEIMHVLGFAHEHVRPDRDQHITILWENIKPGYKQYFEVHNETIVESLPYDYASVLHYPPRAFSRNGKVTILTEPGIKIGQREALSEMDVEKIGILYSNECIKRNREYLLKTCPSVVKPEAPPKPIPQQDIDDYFKYRLWPFGVVTYKFNEPSEFSSEELENIQAVLNHIGNETCVQFQEVSYSNTPLVDDREDEYSGSNEDNRTDDRSSSSYNFDSDELEHVVVLTVSGENETKGISDSTSSELEPHITLNNEIVDPSIAAAIVNNGARMAKNNNNVNTNVGAKVKTKNLIRKPTVLRRKRTRSTPARRHASSILVLSRSSQPGCPCPPPGKPDGIFLKDGIYALTINTDCFNTVNDLLHLFVHVLGLDHQHNMHDRDSYLHIVWDQLTEDVKKEMKKKLPPAASVGFPYDYQSVMHYPWLQIKNGKTNIMYPIWNDGWAMGHWQGLSTTDVQKINILYGKRCNERKQIIIDAMKNKKNDEEKEIDDEQRETRDEQEKTRDEQEETKDEQEETRDEQEETRDDQEENNDEQENKIDEQEKNNTSKKY